MKKREQLIKKVTEIAEGLNFKVVVPDEHGIEFYKFSPYGQDFGFYIDIEDDDDLSDVAKRVIDYYESFDVSYETYIWLDDSGHGQNGAPYEMIDVYNDMKACEGYIEELGDALMNEN